MSKYFYEFTLCGPSPVTVQNGDIVVTKGNDLVTVRDIDHDSSSDSERDQRKLAWERVQDFLGELNYRYGVALHVNESATYGPQPEGQFRHFGRHRVMASVGPAREIPDIEMIASRPDDAKRFLRRAEHSADFLEMFRNVYLAIERATSSYCGGVSMNAYRTELPRVIDEAWKHAGRDLRRDLEADHGYVPKEGIDVAVWLAEILWKENRLPSFHSRAAGSYRVPYRLEDEDKAARVIYLAETVARRIIAAGEAKATRESRSAG